MIEKLAGLYKTKKWLFYLLLPITAVALGIKFYLDYLEGKSKKSIEETKYEDQRIKFQKRQVRKKAKEERKKAEALNKKIEERKEGNVDLDWHLKDEDK